MDNRGELLTKIKGLFGGKGSENKPEVSDENEEITYRIYIDWFRQ